LGVVTFGIAREFDDGVHGVEAVAGGDGEVGRVELEGDDTAGGDPGRVNANRVAVFDLDFAIGCIVRGECAGRAEDGERADGGDQLAAVPGFDVVCRDSVTSGLRLPERFGRVKTSMGPKPDESRTRWAQTRTT
jgi:hypothetical protein